MHLLAERVALLRTCLTHRGHDARGECAKAHVRRFARLVRAVYRRTRTLHLVFFASTLSTTVTHAPLFVKTGVCRPADSGTGTTTRRAI